LTLDAPTSVFEPWTTGHLPEFSAILNSSI
jgi:hypothetical protein